LIIVRNGGVINTSWVRIVSAACTLKPALRDQVCSVYSILRRRGKSVRRLRVNLLCLETNLLSKAEWNRAPRTEKADAARIGLVGKSYYAGESGQWNY